ncbi:hypothetical protein [Sulfuracidifex tepidarius]|uniref:Uncharacterized protein n=1 Tax=Sulfuracidifex tepidarius TaxID=1294262 RepID=A0A510DTC0_9CREN|nr:hypothetical protein [Sulfuracidifex tepidarius]BBG23397.1 hypothetical protein IC006_0681 [Sulfuracidifex tepidarius]
MKPSGKFGGGAIEIVIDIPIPIMSIYDITNKTQVGSCMDLSNPMNCS